MFDILGKYENASHFFFRTTDNLAQVCNAPIDKAGVYVIYSLRKGKVELIYIGRSGQIKNDGSLFVRKGGIKDRLVNGKRDGILRKTFWVNEMIKDSIEALDIYWYVTYDKKHSDCPKEIEDALLDTFTGIYGNSPKWNRK